MGYIVLLVNLWVQPVWCTACMCGGDTATCMVCVTRVHDPVPHDTVHGTLHDTLRHTMLAQA
jgi:hypothetical protein